MKKQLNVIYFPHINGKIKTEPFSLFPTILLNLHHERLPCPLYPLRCNSDNSCFPLSGPGGVSGQRHHQQQAARHPAAGHSSQPVRFSDREGRSQDKGDQRGRRSSQLHRKRPEPGKICTSAKLLPQRLSHTHTRCTFTPVPQPTTRGPNH